MSICKNGRMDYLKHDGRLKLKLMNKNFIIKITKYNVFFQWQDLHLGDSVLHFLSLEQSHWLPLRRTRPQWTVCMKLGRLAHQFSLQIPEKREASDRERPLWDAASRDWPSQPSERQKLKLSRTITTHISALLVVVCQHKRHTYCMTTMLYVVLTAESCLILRLCNRQHICTTSRLQTMFRSNTCSVKELLFDGGM